MDDRIKLSPLTQALILVYAKKKPIAPLGTEKIGVSRTVSAAAFLLEKIRNAVEFRDEHLVRRAAIERIIRRRLLFNPTGEGVAKILIRELIWAKYLPSNSVPETIITDVQKKIDKYLQLRQQLLTHVASNEQTFYSDWLIEIASSEVEESLGVTAERDAFVNYFYQLLRPSVTVDHKSGDERNLQVYIAASRAMAKSDRALLRYQLLKLYLPGIENFGPEKVPTLLPRITEIIRSIETQLRHPIGGRLFLYARRQMPPFLILKDLLEAKRSQASDILANKKKLKESVWSMCARRYSETGQRLKRLAVRSIIYIFITKMALALLIEVPVDRLLQGQVNIFQLGINTLFPPFLMFLITLAVGPPGEGNTIRIYNRIEELIQQIPSEKSRKMEFSTRRVTIRPLLTFFFTFLYGLMFIFSFGAISFVLSLLGFSIVNQLIFVFFLCVITFFGYRIRQTAREHLYEEREGIFTPVFDFFLLPILRVGHVLSAGLVRLNIFTYIFDFFLEIPLKGMLEILEEWFTFIRRKKEEIT